MQLKSGNPPAQDFTAHLEAELDRLAALPPNWNAQGALPMVPEIIEAARHFVECLRGNIVRVPAVVPMAKGNLQFEWNEGPRSLELEIETPAVIHYLKWQPEAGIEDEGVYGINDIPRSLELIRWFQGT